MNPEELRAEFERRVRAGEFASKEAAVAWLGTQGIGPDGNPVAKKGSYFVNEAKANLAGAGDVALRTLGRAAEALDVIPRPAALDRHPLFGRSNLKPGLYDASDRLGAALRPANPERAKQFDKSRTAANFGYEFAKYGATGMGASKLATEGAKRLAQYAAPTLLGAVEDVGSAPEESVPNLLAAGTDKLGLPDASQFFRGQSQSPVGRTTVGALAGFVPDIAFRTPGAIRSARDAVRGAGDVSGGLDAAFRDIARESDGGPGLFVQPDQPWKPGETYSAGWERPDVPVTPFDRMTPTTAPTTTRRPGGPEAAAANAARESARVGVRGEVAARVAAREAEETAALVGLRAAERDAAERVGSFNRDLTGGAAEAHRAALRRGAGGPAAPPPTNAATTAQQMALEALQRNRAAFTGAIGNYGVPIAGAGAAGMSDDPETQMLGAMVAGTTTKNKNRGIPGGDIGRMAASDLDRIMTTHNIGPDYVKPMLEMGGLPAPSLSVTTPRTKPSDFGGSQPVTIVGKAHLTDPRETNIATADTWSMTTPDFVWALDPAKVTSVIRAGDNSFENQVIAATGKKAEWHRGDLERAADGSLQMQENALDRLADAALTNPAFRAMMKDRYFTKGPFFRGTESELREMAVASGQYDPDNYVWDALAESIVSDFQRSMIRKSVNIPGADTPMPWGADAIVEYKKWFGDPRGAVLRRDGGFDDLTEMEAKGARLFRTPEELAEQGAERLAREDSWWRLKVAAMTRMEHSQTSLAAALKGLGGMTPNGEPLDRVVHNAMVTLLENTKNLDPAFKEGIDAKALHNVLADQYVVGRYARAPSTPEAADYRKALNSYTQAVVKGLRAPVTYFEANPMRVVKTDEFAGIMIPEEQAAVREYVKRLAPNLEIGGYSVPPGTKASAIADIHREGLVEFTAKLREKGILQLGAMAPFGVGAGATDDDGEMTYLDWALVAVGLGYAGKRLLRSGATSSALTNPVTRGLVQAEAQRKLLEQRFGRTAVREVAEAERIRYPVSPYPRDPFDEVKTIDDLMTAAPRIINDATGDVDVEAFAKQAIADGRIPPGGVITWEMEQEIADMLQISRHDLATANPELKLSGPEMLALRQQFLRDSNRRLIAAAAKNDLSYTPEVRQMAAKLEEVLEERVINAFTRLSRDRSQSGRDLNSMKQAAFSSDDPLAWLMRAKKLAGGRELDNGTAARITKAVREQDWAQVKLLVGSVRRGNILDRAGEAWQTGLLASISRSMRDLISNTLSVGDAAGTRQVEGQLDHLISTYTGERTAGTGGVGRIATAIWRGGREGAEQSVALMTAGRGGALTDAQKEALRRATERYDLLTETMFESEVMRAYGTFVRRSVGAADQPFYAAAFAMSIEGQARGIAQHAGYRGDALIAATEKLASRPTATMMARAVEDAGETVWQNKTVLGDVTKRIFGRDSKHSIARFVGKILVPFTQTPSAMVTEAVLRSPAGIPFAAMDAVEMLRATSPEAVNSAQRRLVKKLSRMTTGGAWMYLGHMLFNDDKLTEDYPDDPAIRARWEAEGKTPNSVLVYGKWVALSGLLGPQAMLMSIGALIGKNTQQGQSPATATINATIGGVAKTMLESPITQGLQGAGGLIDAAAADDPEDRERGGARAAQSFAGGWVPRIIGQTAAALDTDEAGRTIMRQTGEGEGWTGRARDAIQSNIPLARERLPMRPDPFGEVRTGDGGGPFALLDPFRTSIDKSDALTRTLGESGYFPRHERADSKVNETQEQLLVRRMAQGPQERALLAGIIAGDPAAQEWVSPEAWVNFKSTGDMGPLFQSAITAFRSLETSKRRTAP